MQSVGAKGIWILSMDKTLKKAPGKRGGKTQVSRAGRWDISGEPLRVWLPENAAGDGGGRRGDEHLSRTESDAGKWILSSSFEKI